MGNTLPNHSYVDLNTVGNNEMNSVQCHTNLTTCCNRFNGPHRGDWYFPNKHRVRFSSQGVVYEVRTNQRVDLRYLKAGGSSGIYRCDIDITAGRKTVYVGLYSKGGMFYKLIIPFNQFLAE